MRCFVYSLTNTHNGKVYVGVTSTSVPHRWMRHCADAKRGSPYAIHKAIRKYGPEAFTVQLLEEIEGDRAALMQAEMRHIAEQGCIFPTGYNLTCGGQGGPPTTEQARVNHLAAVRKLAQRPAWKKAHADAMHEVHLRPAWRQAVAAANRKTTKDPKWLQAQVLRTAKLTADPKWREAVANANREKAKSPEWKQAHRDAVRKLALDPEWQKANAEGARRRAANPEWQKAHAETVRLNAETLEWKQAQAEGLRKLIAERDALDPEGAARREKARAYYKRKSEKQRRLQNR